MPLYEYHCPKCDKVVEVLIRNSNEKPSCPDCGEQRITKQLSVAAAPNIGGSSLPTAENCGRPQCGSGCMFD